MLRMQSGINRSSKMADNSLEAQLHELEDYQQRVQGRVISRKGAGKQPSSEVTPLLRSHSPSPKVQVVLRCRPPFPDELDVDGSFRSALKFSASSRNDSTVSENVSVVLNKHGGKRNFQFDDIFLPGANQKKIYERVVLPIVRQVLNDGINGCILAYGQTGTGKSYTMGILHPQHLAKSPMKKTMQPNDGKDMESPRDVEHRGIIPRTLTTVFQSLHENASKRQFQISLSCLQIYLDTIQDLLVPSNKFGAKNLPIRQDKDNEFYVEGLSEHGVKTYDEAHDWIVLAMKNRALASTKRNLTSSRSHTILTIKVIQQVKQTSSKLLLVDLAGSERIHPSLREPTQMKEAKHINKSLAALGNVISALSFQARMKKTATTAAAIDHNNNNANMGSYVRYRDAKLTRLLMSSLSGNFKTVLIATVDAARKNRNETLSTLKFAARCKDVEMEGAESSCKKDLTAKKDKAAGYLEKQQEEQERISTMVAQQVKKERLIVEREFQQRESHLHRLYQQRVEKLTAQLHARTSTNNRTTKLATDHNISSLLQAFPMKDTDTEENLPHGIKSMELSTTCFYALCDIFDRFSIEKTSHLDWESFEDDSDRISYITKMYTIIMDKLDEMPTPMDVGPKTTPLLAPTLKVRRENLPLSFNKVSNSLSPEKLLKISPKSPFQGPQVRTIVIDSDISDERSFSHASSDESSEEEYSQMDIRLCSTEIVTTTAHKDVLS